MTRQPSPNAPQPPTGTGSSPGAGRRPRLSRRAFIAAGGAAGAGAVGAGALAAGLKLSQSDAPVTSGAYRNAAEPFYGIHQGGITTTPQSSTYFAAFDLTAERRDEVAELLRAWTAAAANLTAGRTAKPLPASGDASEPDSGEALGLGRSRLTINFGFGPGLFETNGTDRYGLRPRRPAALVELLAFPGDQLIEQKTGGDLTVQACADDPQVAFHAVRQLARGAAGVAAIRWVQAGFNETPASQGTPRNLMGFKDGTINPATAAQQARFVWAGPEAPAWMRGGTYLVARRIRISLEHWDSKTLDTQEQVIGRYKVSGAPLGQAGEFDPLDLGATGAGGNPVIPADAHVRLSAPQANSGQMILRRSYAYNDGTDPFTERWPPWQQALMYDAGLLFCAYQRDPRTGFIAIFAKLAENDALGQFTTHTGSVIAALPPAAPAPGSFIGQQLLET
jgi:deferrochelatase/peroxidase EfeB